jgi:hypothetical protein
MWLEYNYAPAFPLLTLRSIEQNHFQQMAFINNKVELHKLAYSNTLHSRGLDRHWRERRHREGGNICIQVSTSDLRSRGRTTVNAMAVTWKRMDWLHLAQNWIKLWTSWCSNEPSGFISGCSFPNMFERPLASPEGICPVGSGNSEQRHVCNS